MHTAAHDSMPVILLYENDVHCVVDGYPRLSALKKQLSAHAHVGAVSVGDNLHGASLGVASRGASMVELINAVGYDATALGNHEFDYHLPRLTELAAAMNVPPLCCNFFRIGSTEPVFPPWRMVCYGSTRIAFIGITTPDTLDSSSPIQFVDAEGNYLYTFCGDQLHRVVQRYIDEAKAAHADYIIALSHLGCEHPEDPWSSQALILGTCGLDVVLDGHSHTTLEQAFLQDKSGRNVLLSSTGTNFANIGQLTIEDGQISAKLLPTDRCALTDPVIDALVDRIRADFAVLGERVIGKSLVPLHTFAEDGTRLSRVMETNLGDFCTDAHRIVTGAQIGVIIGGAIRANLSAGRITFRDILNVFPNEDTSCVALVSGQQILDMLEYGAMLWPASNSNFTQVSGLTYAIDPRVPSSVVENEIGEFLRVDGPYRVRDVRVYDRETDTYVPLDLSEQYSLATINYIVVENGNGLDMFKNVSFAAKDLYPDIELMEIYIRDHLGGVIGETYAQPQGRITIL